MSFSWLLYEAPDKAPDKALHGALSTILYAEPCKQEVLYREALRREALCREALQNVIRRALQDT